MATANFQRMEYGMPMICGRTYGQIASEYLKEYGEEISDFEIEMQEQDDFDYAMKLAEEFSASLTFHKVTVVGGYYTSFQFYVEEVYSNYFDLDKESKYCISNEDAHYYFDMCRSKALRAADAEKRKIEKWLHGLAESGYNEVVCTARFSNGKANYNIVTPRTQLIAATVA